MPARSDKPDLDATRKRSASRRRAPDGVPPVNGNGQKDVPAQVDPVPTAEMNGAPVAEAYELTEVKAEQTSLNAGPRSPNRQQVPKPDELRQRLGGHICPFCGSRNRDGRAPCPACGMTDTDGTRSATVRRVGPWFVRSTGNPHAPGMKFSVLRELTKGGTISPDSIVRGPTTRQMWTYAARIRGLAHMFGLCWNCNRQLPRVDAGEDPDDFCLYCGALIEPPGNPDQQLEAAETSESLGVLATNNTAQTSDKAQEKTQPTRERGTGKRLASVSTELGRAVTHPGSAKRVVSRTPGKPASTPRPQARHVRKGDASDGGDALLTTGELATAFNLDRTPTTWGLLKRLPWGWITALLVLAGAAAGVLLIGIDRIRELVGV